MLDPDFLPGIAGHPCPTFCRSVVPITLATISSGHLTFWGTRHLALRRATPLAVGGFDSGFTQRATSPRKRLAIQVVLMHGERHLHMHNPSKTVAFELFPFIR